MKPILSRLFASPGIALELTIATLFANVLVLATPIFVIHVLNRYIAFGVDTTLVTLAAGAVIAIIFEFGFRKVRVLIVENAVTESDQRAAATGMEALTRTPLSLFWLFTANARQQAVSGADTIRQAYSAPNLVNLLDIPFALLFIGALYLLSPPLAGIAMTFVVLTLVFVSWSFFSNRAIAQTRQSASAARSQIAALAVRSAETPRVFDAAGWVKKQTDSLSEALGDADATMARRQDTVQTAIQSVIALMTVAIISVGAYLAVRGALDIGALVGANILAARALSPFARLAGLVRLLTSAQDVDRTLAELDRVKKRDSGGTTLSDYKGRMAIEDVSMNHAGAKTPLFEGLSVELEAGATLAVSGPNGSGKTTFARMIAGVLEPTRGRILVDGVDLTQVDPNWWQTQISYLPQEPRFFPTTIAENLKIANPKLSETELSALVDVAGLRQFVDESADGLGRVLADGGDELALGIRRRLALARALAVGAPILLVDEPTEALDDEGKAIVYNAMNRHKNGGGTIVACAHDPFILKGADWVVDLSRKPQPRVSRLPKTATEILETGA